jgi:hypothetical protein
MSTMHTAGPFPAPSARPALGRTLAVIGGALTTLVALAADPPFRPGR